MEILQEAQKSKPKKPLNAYFKFRIQKMAEFAGFENRNVLFEQCWHSLDPLIRQNMETEYVAQMLKYRIELEQWQKKFSPLLAMPKQPLNEQSKQEQGEKKPYNEAIRFHTSQRESPLSPDTQLQQALICELRERVGQYRSMILAQLPEEDEKPQMYAKLKEKYTSMCSLLKQRLSEVIDQEAAKI